VISAQINDVAYRLDLPPHLRQHPIFHCSLLEPCTTSTIPNCVQLPPPPVQLLDGPEYEVVAILDSKFSHGKLLVLMIELGNLQTIYIMLKLLSMRSISSIHISLVQDNNLFRLTLLVVLGGGWCHDTMIYYC
jgi:hypothetical protein